MKNHTTLNAEKSAKIESVKLSLSCFLQKPDPESTFFCLKPYPDKDRVNKINIQIDPSVPEEIGFKHTNIGTYIDRVAIV